MKNKLFQVMAAAFLILVALLLMGGDRVRIIDNFANVENYGYKGNYDNTEVMPLKECDYSFWENVVLPGTGQLFSAAFREKGKSRMTAYCYDENHDRLVAENVYQIPPKVQGVAFDAAGNVWFSMSYGRKNSSFLLKYKALTEVGEEGVQPEAVVELPPCSEKIAIQNGKLYIVFESACRKYKEGTDGRGKSRSPLDKILLLEKFSEI